MLTVVCGFWQEMPATAKPTLDCKCWLTMVNKWLKINQFSELIKFIFEYGKVIWPQFFPISKFPSNVYHLYSHDEKEKLEDTLKKLRKIGNVGGQDGRMREM